jgi:carboxyl-terminal processing protease
MANLEGNATSDAIRATAVVYNTNELLAQYATEIERNSRKTAPARPVTNVLPQQDGGVPGTCPAAIQYQQIINLTAHYMFEPKKLGDLDQLRSRFNCAKDKDPILVANAQLKPLVDRFTYVMSPEDYSIQKKSYDARWSGGIGFRLWDFDIDRRNHPIFPVHSDNPTPSDEEKPGQDKPHQMGVLSVFPDTPAAKAGFLPGDLILKVGDTDARGMKVDELADLMQGPNGSEVKLTVLRDGKPVTKLVRRQDIFNPSVDEPRQIDGFTYIKIDRFAATTPAEIAKAVMKFPNTNGYILDVRDNPGGLILGAIRSAEIFLKNGTITRISVREESDPAHPTYDQEVARVEGTIEINELVSSKGDVDIMPAPRQPYLAGGKPIVLITNGNSASAAEMFTGALADNGFVVVGSAGDPHTRGNKGSFGKGVGQSSIELPAGNFLHVTRLEYRTPCGKWPGNAKDYRPGLSPDIAVSNPDGVVPGSKDDAQLDAAVAELHKELREAPTKKICS